MNYFVEEPVVTYNQINLSFTNYTKARKLEPIVKWAGGKEQELKYIIPDFTDFLFVPCKRIFISIPKVT